MRIRRNAIGSRCADIRSRRRCVSVPDQSSHSLCLTPYNFSLNHFCVVRENLNNGRINSTWYLLNSIKAILVRRCKYRSRRRRMWRLLQYLCMLTLNIIYGYKTIDNCNKTNLRRYQVMKIRRCFFIWIKLHTRCLLFMLLLPKNACK